MSAGLGRRETPAAHPGGYAMWVAWIDAFRRGDDRDTAGLPPIDGGMGTYVEARLLERLSVAFSERVRSWQTAVGERIVAQPPADPAAVAALLRSAAPGLEPLVRVAGSPLLPRGMSIAMQDLVAQTRAGARDAVEEGYRRRREPELEPRLPRARRGSPVAPPVPPRTAATTVSAVPAPRGPGAVGSVRPLDRSSGAPRPV